MNLIARTIVLALTEYFDIPFREPSNEYPKKGVVQLTSGTLNLRERPSLDAAIIASIPNGASITLLGDAGDWYEVSYNNKTGYVSKVYVVPA